MKVKTTKKEKFVTRISIGLTDAMYKKLIESSESSGIPLSTLGTILIDEALETRKRNEEIIKSISGDEVAKTMQKLTELMLKSGG